MAKSSMIIVECTQAIRVDPSAERKRFKKHFEGRALERLLSLVDLVEAGNFYEGAKTYYKYCTREEREAVGEGMSRIFEGVGERQVRLKAWEERPAGALVVQTVEGLVDGKTLEYPKFSLAVPTPPALDQLLGEGDSSPTP